MCAQNAHTYTHRIRSNYTRISDESLNRKPHKAAIITYIDFFFLQIIDWFWITIIIEITHKKKKKKGNIRNRRILYPLLRFPDDELEKETLNMQSQRDNLTQGFCLPIAGKIPLIKWKKISHFGSSILMSFEMNDTARLPIKIEIYRRSATALGRNPIWGVFMQF